MGLAKPRVLHLKLIYYGEHINEYKLKGGSKSPGSVLQQIPKDILEDLKSQIEDEVYKKERGNG